MSTKIGDVAAELGLGNIVGDSTLDRIMSKAKGKFGVDDTDRNLSNRVLSAIAKYNRVQNRKSRRAEAEAKKAESAKKKYASDVKTGKSVDVDEKRYLINENFSNDIDAWVKDGCPDGEKFILGMTGDVLQGLGAIESDLYMNSDKINLIMSQHPEITIEEIKKIPQILEDPVLVLKSQNKHNSSQNTRLVMFGSVKGQNGKPVLAVMDLRPVENNFVIDDMQKVSSAYTKTSSPVDFVKNSDILYADKKRTTSLLRTIGFQMPIELRKGGYIGSISYVGQNVNIVGEKFDRVFSLNNNDMQNSEDNSSVDEKKPKSQTSAKKSKGKTADVVYEKGKKLKVGDTVGEVTLVKDSETGDPVTPRLRASFSREDMPAFLMATIESIGDTELIAALEDEIAYMVTSETIDENTELPFHDAIEELSDHVRDGDITPTEAAQILSEELANPTDADIDTLVERAKLDGVKYMVGDFSSQVDDVLNDTYDKNNHVYMGRTPYRLSGILGIKKLPMLITNNHVYTMTVSEEQAKEDRKYNKKAHYHDLGAELVKKLPKALNRPVMIIKSNNDNTTADFVVLTDLFDKNGDMVIVAVKPSGQGKYYGVKLESNIAKSGYGKKNILNYVNTAKSESRILYVYKKYNQQKQNGTGVQFPDSILSADYDNSLSQYKRIVNSQYMQKTENDALANYNGDDIRYFLGDDTDTVPAVDFKARAENILCSAFDTGKMTVVAVVSDKHLDLFVQTAYVGIKKGNLATPIDEQASINTPEASHGTVSNKTISQPESKVKSKTSKSQTSAKKSKGKTADVVYEKGKKLKVGDTVGEVTLVKDSETGAPVTPRLRASFSREHMPAFLMATIESIGDTELIAALEDEIAYMMTSETIDENTALPFHDAIEELSDHVRDGDITPTEAAHILAEELANPTGANVDTLVERAKLDGVRYMVGDIDSFDISWYNEIEIPSDELNRLQSEVMTWDNQHRNGLRKRTLSNGYTYVFLLDKTGIVHVFGRTKSTNIHERRGEYDNASGEKPDRFAEEFGLRQGNDGRFSDIGKNGQEQVSTWLRNLETLWGEGDGNRTGYTENDPYAYGRSEEDQRRIDDEDYRIAVERGDVENAQWYVDEAAIRVGYRMLADGSMYATKPSAPNKSAAYATYTDSGRLIPLSQRFDESISDYRYLLGDDTDTVPAVDFKARAENIMRLADMLQDGARNDAEYAALSKVKNNAENIVQKYDELAKLKAELKAAYGKFKEPSDHVCGGNKKISI